MSPKLSQFRESGNAFPLTEATRAEVVLGLQERGLDSLFSVSPLVDVRSATMFGINRLSVRFRNSNQEFFEFSRDPKTGITNFYFNIKNSYLYGIVLAGANWTHPAKANGGDIYEAWGWIDQALAALEKELESFNDTVMDVFAASFLSGLVGRTKYDLTARFGLGFTPLQLLFSARYPEIPVEKIIEHKDIPFKWMVAMFHDEDSKIWSQVAEIFSESMTYVEEGAFS
jgi:hypothetical protein